jgi:hypothetical protein
MRKIEKDDTVYGQEYVLHSEALKEIDEMQAEIDSLRRDAWNYRGLITGLLDTELGELACTGSYAPVEDLLGRMQDALSEESKGTT